MYIEYKNPEYRLLPPIPTHWDVRTGRLIFSEVKDKNSDLNESLLLQFSYGTIVRKKVQDASERTDDVYSKYSVVNENDIVINGLNLNYDFVSQRIGKVNEKGIITSAYFIVRGRTGYNPHYYTYLLKALDEQKVFHGMGSGIRLTLGYPEFSKMMFPVPSIEEQDQIVRYLDWKTSRINHLIHGYQKQIELLKERRLTVIDTAVTKGLNPNVAMKESSTNWMGVIPSHWSVEKIKQHFHIKKDIAGKEGYDVISITQQGLKIKDISTNEGQMAQSYAKYQFVNPGDYAMNHMDLLTGYIGLSECFGVTSPDYRVFMLDDIDNCDPEYYLYVFQLGYKRKIFYGLGRGAANKGRWRMPAVNFKNYDIPMPPLAEQKEIVAFIQSETSKIDVLIDKIENQISFLREYRTRLISDVVTGQIDVRDVVIPEYVSEEDKEETSEEESEVMEDANN